MVEYSREIDFDKYNTFILEYMKDENQFSSHIVRPTSATYEEITDTDKFRSYTLEAAILSFKHETSLAEILIECSLYGIFPDFIDIYVPNDKKGWLDEKTKISQVIDTHKEDITKCLGKVEAKRHYVALNTNRSDTLRFLIVDRFSQDTKVEFLKGKYEKKGIIAGFKDQMEAKRYCEKMNDDQ